MDPPSQRPEMVDVVPMQLNVGLVKFYYCLHGRGRAPVEVSHGIDRRVVEGGGGGGGGVSNMILE